MVGEQSRIRRKAMNKQPSNSSKRLKCAGESLIIRQALNQQLLPHLTASSDRHGCVRVVDSQVIVHDLLIQPENVRRLQGVEENRISTPHSLVLKRIFFITRNQRVVVDDRIPATDSIG